MTSDVELVERSRARDADAFGKLVARHQQLVFGVALARCRDAALAEDLAQEAFVTAWRDLDRLRDGNRIGSWVAGIARNLAASAVRTRVRRDGVPIEPPADVPSPEDHAVEREDRELLARALAEIPEAHREALVLYYLQGESVAQIAAVLGVTEDLVKQRLSRARRALRETVAERVESVLARARPRPGFGALVVASLSTASARKAAAGKVIVSMTAKKIVLVVLALAVASGAALWLVNRTTPRATSATAASPAGSANKPHATRLDKASRDALVAAIHEARAKRVAQPAGASQSSTSSTSGTTSSGARGSAPTLPDEDGDLDKAYIRSAMQEIIPLLTECYSEGLTRDPTLAGNVAVDFTIEGEPGVGGVIGNSTIDPTQSTLPDPAVRECIQETMYALEIDPPKNGGTVQVHYPFTFAPHGSDN